MLAAPLTLERGNAAEKFKLRARLEDFAANLSLEAYLDRVHGLKLPTFEAGEDFDPSRYAAEVAEAVAAKPGWTVQEDDLVLGFFSFAKFLMYRDLDPQTWPANAKLADHRLIRPLLSEGFPEGEPLLSEDDPVDAHVPPERMVHIVDSDSSQTLAIEEVRRGRDLVIQGPPGTGKSQTIANVIAATIADGKTVLFVAEKMAALEVVKRRLDNAGVGDACLELHSNKANKRAVLEELRRTWELGAPKTDNLRSLNARLTEARDTLNAHAERLHRPAGAAGCTPYDVIGHLVRLRQNRVQPAYLKLHGVHDWDYDEFDRRSKLVTELAERVLDLGAPSEHLWRGIGLDRLLPPDIVRLTDRLASVCERLAEMRANHAAISACLEVEAPEILTGLDGLMALAHRLSGAPELEPAALDADVWDDAAGICALLTVGAELVELKSRLEGVLKPSAWDQDLEGIQEALKPLASTTPLTAFDRAAKIAAGAPELIEQGRRLAEAIGREAAPSNLAYLDALAATGERVAAAPEADPAAFAQDLWDLGVERAADLARAVQEVEAARAEIGNGLGEGAWNIDLAAARRTLAAHGASFLRFLNGEWRAADRLVRSFQTDPKAPLERRLAWLDALSRGQAALRLIREDAEFGRSAFGADWRGERSVSTPLLALADWMRSLRGLGAEPRLVAARRPDRMRIGGLANALSKSLQALRHDIGTLWDELGAARATVFGDTSDLEAADLRVVLEQAQFVAAAHQAYLGMALTVDPSLDLRRQTLADLGSGQAAVATLTAGDGLGESGFGAAWQGQDSDWAYLSNAAHWIANNADIRRLASRIPDRPALLARAEAAIETRERWIEDVTTLLSDLKAGPDAALTADRLRDTEVAILVTRLGAWRDGGEDLSNWVGYRARADEANGLGLADVVARLHDGRLQPACALDDFEQAYFEAVLERQVDEDPSLATFDGEAHGRRVREFVDLDQQRIRAAAMQVAHEHHKRVPPLTGGAVGPLGVLKSEIARKRGHMPIRQLMSRAAPAVQALKPVFMMSPLSVAQFMPPGALTFDLLVMDEASQIQPVDALGSIARCRQVVVVGDPQQLPPTAFFAKMTSQTDDGEEDEGAARVGDIESILGLFTARGLPMRMLRWHYRSRHESLIAISNRQFYDSKLVIVPSPFTQQAGLGLRFNHIKDGVFQTGTTRTNPVEANAVAQAIVHHARTSPNLSLGVVAFSAAQRKAILEQLEVLRRQLPPEVENFFQQHPAEPFFVKNLENVQGDERDVILISIGYGPTSAGGKPPMRFGPVGQEGGERRLNVLISRAKRRCEVFSSMTDEDIDPDFASSRKGVFALKLFMHFARTGRMSLAESVGRDGHAIFEGQVAHALHERGYQVHREVGVSGLFVDIAVSDPDRPDRYLIALECDGPSYKAARSARDRDRLRRSVLENQGWIVHRIWSGDWFAKPNEQLERAVAAIEAAKIELGRETGEGAPRPAYEIVSVEREDVTEMGLAVEEGDEPLSQTYAEVSLVRPAHVQGEIHEAPTGLLSQLAEAVVAGEGPVHFDEVVARIRTAWDRGRAGVRIRDAVRRATNVSVREGRIVGERDFFSVPGAVPTVRDRSATASPGLRRPEMLPPAEIETALLAVVSRNFGATPDQAVVTVARALGFKAVSAQLREAIMFALEEALEKGVLIQRDTLIDSGPNAPKTIKAPKRTPLQELISGGEGNTLEFKQTLRVDLRGHGQHRKVEDSAMRAIAAFANHSGGALLIGVCDDGTITGLAPDLATFGESRDRFDLHLTNLIQNRFSEAFRAGCVSVSYPTEGDKIVCRIDVRRSRTPVYLSIAEGNGAATERLIVRSGASSPEIPLSQVADYVREHFGR